MLKTIILPGVTHPDIQKLLFDLPCNRCFLPSFPDVYVDAMARLFDFSSPGKCTIPMD
eukprot:COSAG02_NODE_57236_length_281_cov_0.862637_1_plen_57_part_01